ncbi:hypothetical protein EGJ27_07865 [Pseudomonas sp. v388]|nr:hypothetical protein EGJ27_07865 [Pseudomonas sp. v388]
MAALGSVAGDDNPVPQAPHIFLQEHPPCGSGPAALRLSAKDRAMAWCQIHIASGSAAAARQIASKLAPTGIAADAGAAQTRNLIQLALMFCCRCASNREQARSYRDQGSRQTLELRQTMNLWEPACWRKC